MTAGWLRHASAVLFACGMASGVTLFLDIVWPPGAWALTILWIAFAVLADVIAEIVLRRNERDVARIRDEHR